MDREDPERRIDELERQLEDARRQASEQPPAQFSNTGPIPIPGVGRLPSDARARRNARFQAYARTMYPIVRRNQQQKKLLGHVLLWFGAAIGLWGFVLVSSLVLFPSTALWTSDFVCSSPYHLQYDKSTVGASSSVTFRCDNSESYYSATAPVVAIQAIAVALVAAVVTTIGFLVWRRMRKRKF